MPRLRGAVPHDRRCRERRDPLLPGSSSARSSPAGTSTRATAGGRARSSTFPRRPGGPRPARAGRPPGGFPDPWVEGDRRRETRSSRTWATSGPTIRGTRRRTAPSCFDPADATGDDQKVLNIFYFNCVMHDFFYLLGFRERGRQFPAGQPRPRRRRERPRRRARLQRAGVRHRHHGDAGRRLAARS